MNNINNKHRRVFGDKISFKSLSCAPVNELGVVYLFGVLHDLLDLSIESIQSGFPDCIARRRVSENRWEEVRIEFEYESKNFADHKHNPNGCDMIVCWRHNWNDCPSNIEVIELCSFADIEKINKNGKQLSEWNLFCRQKRLEGYSFSDISKMWKKKAS